MHVQHSPLETHTLADADTPPPNKPSNAHRQQFEAAEYQNHADTHRQKGKGHCERNSA